MALDIQAIRGMNDCLPAQAVYWRHLEQCLINTAMQYGYNEIRFPLVERTELFTRGIGAATDIVEKEMYTFDDRNGDNLALRPEGTAGCVRAALEHGLLHNQTQRLWYLGPMFRHERPQRGRYRQFHQFGIEAFGMAGPDIDAEIILQSARVWQALGLTAHITLQLNSLGNVAARARYRAQLVEYFTAHFHDLDADSQRRLHTNPLRILDSKHPQLQPLIAAAPLLTEYLDDAARDHFQGLCAMLDHAGVAYEINPRLVRGLDYYTGTVFEWVTDLLGAQGAVCSGGRYDGLVELLGGKPTTAVGYAAGLERIVELLLQSTTLQQGVDVYVVAVDELAERQAVVLAEQWRTVLADDHVVVNCGGGSFKTQLKRADKSGAKWAFILGPEEIASAMVTVKSLRDDRPQQTVAVMDIGAILRN